MNSFTKFRRVGLAEGISFLALLSIAMPLKYFAGMPIAVTIAGGLHGILFITFIILAYYVKETHKKDNKWFLKAFLASIIPFGTFVMDREWKRDSSNVITKT